MNQPPDPNQQNLQPNVDASNNVPPTLSASVPLHYEQSRPYAQPGSTPYLADYNQPGNYPPPGYPPQQPPTGYPLQQSPPSYPPDYNQPGTYPPPAGYSPQSFPTGYPPDYNHPGNYPAPDYPPQQPPPMGYSPQPFPAGYPPQQPGQWVGYPPQGGMPQRRKTGWIIGGISVAVVIAIIAVALIATHGFRQEPPSSWLAQYSPNTTTTITYVYFIHWTNQDGQLNGSMDEASSNGQSISYTIDGTYDYQNHTVILHVRQTTLSMTITITGDINGNTMTLHAPSTSSTSTATDTDIVFHSASQQDYNNAKQQI